MIFGLRFAAIASLVAFVAGSAAGGIAVYKLWQVSDLSAKNNAMAFQLKTIAKALDISTKMDDDNAAIELTNGDIINAINRKSAVPPPPDDPIVLDGDGLRILGSLR